jgi:DHA1 family tetracycline resistance protein-like MFS transporter
VKKFGFTEGRVGNYFAYVGIWIAIAQAIVTPFVAKRFSSIAILRYALVITGIAIFIQVLPHHVGVLYIIVPFFAIANGLVMANLNGLISRSAGADVQGEILGINASVQALGQSIPPILAGYIAASIVFSTPIVVSSILIVTAGIVFTVFTARNARILDK